MRLILPNLVTLLSICAGLTAMRMALEDRWDHAIWLILLAAILDMLDGRIARFLKGTSRFGAELDSLADFINFGVAPIMILYGWILSEMKTIGWITALIFAICMAMRLARFNIGIDDSSQPSFRVHFFSGVPAPAGALLVMFPIYLEYMGVPHYAQTAPAVALYCIAIALLVISTLPTYSGKKIGARIRREYVLPLIIGMVIAIALFVSFPFQMLTASCVLYLGLIPFAFRTAKRLQHEFEQRESARSTDQEVEKGEDPAAATADPPSPLGSASSAPESDDKATR